MRDDLRIRMERAIAKEAANKHVFAVGRGGPRYERVDQTEYRLLIEHARRTAAFGGPDDPRAA